MAATASMKIKDVKENESDSDYRSVWFVISNGGSTIWQTLH